jgi:serine/threonine-protein kinase RsbW
MEQQPMETGRLLAKLTVVANINVIPSICSFVRQLALQNGMSESEAGNLELVAEEACLNVIQHAFKGSSEKYYEVHIENRPGQFVLAIQDQGVPIDWKKLESGEQVGLGMRLIKSFSDQVRFINLGRGGKRIEFIKNFMPARDFFNIGSEAAHPEGDGGEIAPQSVPISFRRLEENDLGPLARCMYEVYGYTYKDVVYYPEKMKELIDSGLLFSAVGVTADGEIAAHQGLRKDSREDRIAEVAMGMVSPGFRGRGLFEKIKAYSFEEIKKEGVYGLYTQIVANHPYSQKANLALGAKETGIMLGTIPSDMVFHGISGPGEARERTSLVFTYTRLGPEPERVVYPPFIHETMIRKIYEHGDFNRVIRTAVPQELTSLPEHSLVDVKLTSEFRMANLRVLTYGKDFENMMRIQLREMCVGKFDCIYVDLQLSDPATQLFCSALEMMGFFFAGLAPELSNGDVLRLQYFNNVTIDPDRVVIVSDFGAELFKYVLQCWGH